MTDHEEDVESNYIGKLLSRIAELEDAIEELEEALRPFARLNDCATGDKWRDYETQWINRVYETDYAPTIKQLRRARAALGEDK
jgi:hypothetical protein